VINLYYLYSCDSRRLLRLVFFALLPGVITILCHAEGFFPPLYLNGGHDLPVIQIPYREFYSPAYTHIGDVHAISAAPKGISGPPPRAENDFATTAEEIPVTIDVLSNDRSGKSDGRDDDRSSIDRASVDLDPDSDGIQSSRETAQGSYDVDQSGHVTFNPAKNFFGNSTISYTVKSYGNETSNRATISVTVDNVNDAPAIIGQTHQQINAKAGQPITITLADLVITDADNQAPADFILTVLPGDNYTVSGQAVTPLAHFSGVLPVQITVGDGAAVSEVFPLTMLVTDENAAPVITGQEPNPIVSPEDQPLEIALTYLRVTDPDDTDFIIKVGAGANYTVSGQTITPAANFSGALSVPVVVNDGEADSQSFPLQISVTPVNDRPVITGQTPDPIPASQGQPVTITLSNVIVSDPDNVAQDFSLSVLQGVNYTVSGNTITPVAGFSGQLAVNVTANDPTTSSDSYPLRVSVAANTPPVITGQSSLATNEDTPLTIALSNLIVTDPDNSYPAGFTFRLAPGTNYSVSGDVVSPAANFEGALTVPVVVNDGISDSQPFNLQITVLGVNDIPVITGHVPLTTLENQPITLALSHLTVSDPDSPYPGSFTLSVLAGENYSVSGSQITPAPGFSGPLTVRVFVNDGNLNSEIVNVVINVNPVNDPPVISGQQRPLEITEGSAILLSLADVIVTDPDNTFPNGFTMAVQPGDQYTFSGLTVTPLVDFTGTLNVNVIVNDGASNSAPFPLQITVVPVNDAPFISGQQTLVTSEDVSFTVELTHLLVTDPDSPFPTGFTLALFPGTNYTLSGNTVIPAPNYYGVLTVQAQVSDGYLSSNIFNLAIQVSPVNDAPVITGQVPVETAEDTPVTIQLPHLSVLDVDNAYPSGFTLSVSAGSNYSVSGSTVTPAVDFNGTLNVSVAVSDGGAVSAPFAFQIQVGNANDAPVITGQAALSTNEETPVSLQLSHLTVSDPDNAYPGGFSMLVSAGANYSVSGQTITPALNFAGVLSIPVRVNDGVNNSATFNFQLQVNQINDAPVFAAIPNQKLAENAAAGSITITGISKGPMEDYQQLTFVATSSNTAVVDNPVIQYNGTGATALLSYVVKPNASGIVTINIVAIDNGSNVAPHQNSYAASFQIEVMEINTAPTLNAINNITLMEDAEQQNFNLTGISAGAGESQSLSVTVATDKPNVFDLLEVVYTSPEANGLLRFKTKPNIFGTVQISVSVTDNGSGVSPHVNRITRSFAVVIQPVNDAPVFTSQPVTVAVVEEEYSYFAKATDPDGDQVAITAASKPSWASITASGNGEAKLSGRPPSTALGNVEVKLNAKDATTTIEQAFSVYVNVRPSVTPLSLVTEEDMPLTFSTTFFASAYSDMNNNPMVAIQVTTLPAAGQLLLSEVPVKVGDTIGTSSLGGLRYTPHEDYFGMDSFSWKAFDGYHFSLSSARADISVLSVNDPPQIILAGDTLVYEVNGEPAFIAPLIEITDPDDDSLTHAAVGFYARNYRPETDLIEFSNTTNIRGNFDFQSGLLQFSGAATIAEYRNALRSIRYLHQNTLDPLLEPKTVFFTLNDGQTESVPKDKLILLQYTFIEFEIPSGFTPNGDQANDTWIIDRPGGGLDEMDHAVISVYNKKGILVFRAKGFDRPWDGTMNGELLPADTYFFTIDLQLRNKKTYKGIVTILR
jgi:large repetitive protein